MKPNRRPRHGPIFPFRAGFYFGLLLVAFLLCPSLQSFSPYALAFWSLAAIVKVLYYIASFANPGVVFKVTPPPPAVEEPKFAVHTEEVPIEAAFKSNTPQGNAAYLKFQDEPTVPPLPSEAAPPEEGQELDPIQEKSDTTYSAGSQGSSEEAEQSQELEISERRFCVVCEMDQPLRSKHCKSCGHCIALHDHHCPWLGVCIGELNRRKFYTYVAAQTALLWWGTVEVSARQMLESFSVGENVAWSIVLDACRALVVVVLLFFTLMVTCLFAFHTFLATRGVTTWEFVSWSKISYLQGFERARGSPFSKGFLQNLHFYCCSPPPEHYTVWTAPQPL